MASFLLAPSTTKAFKPSSGGVRSGELASVHVVHHPDDHRLMLDYTGRFMVIGSSRISKGPVGAFDGLEPGDAIFPADDNNGKRPAFD